jgi:hypothetical protein
MAIFGATGGSEEGRKIFHTCSQKSKQNRYDEEKTDKRWESYQKSPPTRIGAGTLFHYAYLENPHWRDEYDRELDARFSAKFDTSDKKRITSETENVPPPKENEPSNANEKPKAETKTENPNAETRTEKPKAKEFDPLFDPWAKFVVPNFPLDVLPEVLRVFIVERSAVIGCDPSGLAMAVLTACSGALDHPFQAENDEAWQLVCRAKALDVIGWRSIRQKDTDDERGDWSAGKGTKGNFGTHIKSQCKNTNN